MVPVEFIGYIVAAFLGAISVQIVAFTISVLRKRIDVVDIAWGLSFIAAWISLQVYKPSISFVTIAVSAMVLAWGLRLALHIGRRFLHAPKQDERYTALMKSWPTNNRVAQSFFRIFLLQAILVTVISLPIATIYYFNPDANVFFAIGLIIWLIGYGFEVIADRQLKQFLRSAKPGSLMQGGLWKYSRHPNYFGEVTMWWGIALIAASTPLWWLGMIGAATITILICFVSGIPPAEARTALKPGWAEYKRKTNILIPLPPKK